MVLHAATSRGSIKVLHVYPTLNEEEQLQKAKMAEEQQEASQGDMEGERNSFGTKIFERNRVIPFASKTHTRKCLSGLPAAFSLLPWSTGSEEGERDANVSCSCYTKKKKIQCLVTTGAFLNRQIMRFSFLQTVER